MNRNVPRQERPSRYALGCQEGYRRLESTEGLCSASHIEKLVEFLCKDADLTIPGLPDSIKHSLYSKIVSIFLSTFLNTFYNSMAQQDLMGHHLDIYMSNAKDLQVQKQMKELEEEEESGRKMVAVDEVEDLVDQILANEDMNLGYLPDSLEKPLYQKTVHVVIHCIQYVLVCTEFDFCGYSFRGTFDAIHNSEETSSIVKVVRADLGPHRHEVDKNILRGVIEEATKDITGIASVLERQTISGVYQLAIYLVFELLKELVFNILGDNCRLRLMPGAPGTVTAHIPAGLNSNKNSTSPKKRRRVFTTKWVKKRINALSSPSKESGSGSGIDPQSANNKSGTATASSTGASTKKGQEVDDRDPHSGFLGFLTPGKGKYSKKAMDKDEEKSSPGPYAPPSSPRDDPMPCWDGDDEAGVQATWRNVEGETLARYLRSYKPPRAMPANQKYVVREDQLDHFTRQILHGGEYKIPGIPEVVEVLMYRAVVRTGMQNVLTTFQNGISKVSFFGHHLELDIEEGISFPPVKKKSPNLGAVSSLAQVLLNDPDVNLSFLPDFIERQLYVNVLLISLLLVQNVCDTSCLDIFGHSLGFTLNPLSTETTLSLRKKMFLDVMSSAVPASTIDDEVLAEYVEHKDEQNNGELYRGLMTAVYRISLYVAREALSDVAIFLLEDGYVMRIAPGPPRPKADAKNTDMNTDMKSK